MILRKTRRKAIRVEPGEIGIPRALYFFYHPGLWESFFASLGFTPVVSAPTSRRTVERAGRIAEAEHCLPVKLFQAHLHELVEKVDRKYATDIPRSNGNSRQFALGPVNNLGTGISFHTIVEYGKHP